ncbi:MAG TPA: hypothetical protein V6C58_07375 [Allocoleopsis sp.]
MNENLSPPSLERVKQRAEKAQEIFKQADAGILILDELIAQLEEKIHHSPLYQYRLNQAKRLLKL